MLLGGLRRHHEFVAAERTIAAQWQQFLADDEVAGRIGEHAFGVMCGADATGFEYMCAVEVRALSDLPGALGKMRVPVQRYAVFEHHGSTQSLRSSWQNALAWLAASDFESAHKPDFELYEPPANPLSPSEGIEIWLGVVDG